MVLVERRIPRVVTWLLVATLVASIAAAVGARHGVWLYQWLALVPDDVWHGQLWRLATWTLVHGGALALVFGCVTLYWFGGDLAGSWGERRFARFVAAVVVGAAAVTSVVALVVPAVRHHGYLAGWALGDALVIAWALRFPERRVRLYLVLELGGRPLVYVTLAVTAVFAAFYGIWAFLPEIVAGAATFAHLTGAPRRLAGRLERLRRRRHLRVVRGGRDDPGWMN
jgi:membrane associated rhomboid family serine protease